MGKSVKVFYGYDVVKEDWIALEKEDYCGFVFQRFAWVHHWYKSVESGKERVAPINVVVYNEDAKPIALFPFFRRMIFGFQVIEWAGGVFSDYNSPICNDEFQQLDNIESGKILKLIIHQVGEAHVFHLKKCCLSRDGRKLAFMGLLSNISLRRSYGYVANLGSEFEEFSNQKIGKKQKADSVRQIRRLKEIGDLKFLISSDSSVRLEIIEWLIKHKRQRYQKIGAKDILGHNRNRDFYKNLELIANNGSDIMVHTSALQVEGRIIAAHLGVVDRNRFYYLMPTFDNSMGKYGPGRLLLENLIEWAIENELDRFDFTGGDESYKKVWVDEKVILFDSIKPVKILGWIYKILIVLAYKLNNAHPSMSKLFLKRKND